MSFGFNGKPQPVGRHFSMREDEFLEKNPDLKQALKDQAAIMIQVDSANANAKKAGKNPNTRANPKSESMGVIMRAVSENPKMMLNLIKSTDKRFQQHLLGLIDANNKAMIQSMSSEERANLENLR